jgi:hypothetical protein
VFGWRSEMQPLGCRTLAGQEPADLRDGGLDGWRCSFEVGAKIVQ